jgi:acetylornithine/succinyldiaminopimelate/putrescine aminotransferase
MDNRIARMPKVEGGTFKSSPQALDYARAVLESMHREEVWTLAERLDDAMSKVVNQFVAEIRK